MAIHQKKYFQGDAHDRHLIPGFRTGTLVDQLHPLSGTGVSALSELLNNNYGAYVHGESVSMIRHTDVGSFYNYMSNMFSQKPEALLATIVNIKSGNSYPAGDPDSVNGQLGTTGGINHWILITGVSAQWHGGSQESHYNWVRIFNPFDNQTEYYWWPDFSAAWSKPGPGTYTSLKIQQQ